MLGRAMLMVVFGITACAPSDDASAVPTRMCSQRSGTFVTTLVEQSGAGTCGPQADVTESYDVQPSAPQDRACTGSVQYIDYNCTEQRTFTCSPKSASGVMSFRGRLTWDESGTRASGEYVLGIKGDFGADTCNSAYYATVTKTN